MFYGFSEFLQMNSKWCYEVSEKAVVLKVFFIDLFVCIIYMF